MVTVTYLDTSAALKLLIEEDESRALVDSLTSGGSRRLVSSWLLHTELHCAAGRRPEIIDLADVATVLAAVDLVDLSRGDFLAAGTLSPLRSNDALHLAVAIRLGADELLTYDAELQHAAARGGIAILAPT